MGGFDRHWEWGGVGAATLIVTRVRFEARILGSKFELLHLLRAHGDLEGYIGERN
jgi:hypothetical protein